jgi:hypothetical protein
MPPSDFESYLRQCSCLSPSTGGLRLLRQIPYRNAIRRRDAGRPITTPDPPHSLRLLCPRRERPCRCTAD